MAEYLHFSRDSKLYIQKDGRLWYIPVLDGFNFSQSTNTSEITLSEMEDVHGRSRRGRKMFTDSLAPAEWSFSSYIRPFRATANVTSNGGRADDQQFTHAIEEVLWAAMAGRNEYSSNQDYDFKASTTLGGPITAITAGSPSTGTTWADGTYNFSVSATTPQANVTTSGNGENAAIQVVVSSFVATVTVTEAGTKFQTNDTITVDGSLLGGTNTDDLTLTVRSQAVTRNGTGIDDGTVINFKDSNRAQLGTFDMFFVFSNRSDGRLVYRLADAMVNEATVNFDVDGLGTIEWSGFASQITDVTSSTTAFTTNIKGTNYTNSVEVVADSAARDALVGPVHGDIAVVENEADSWYVYGESDADGTTDTWIHAIDEGTSSTENFIRNRITQLQLEPVASFKDDYASGYWADSYSLPLTGGSFTISNNGNYLTPEELGIVNQPLEHVTGTRSVTANFTCYLGSSDVATNRSKDLFEALVSDNTTVINKFDVTFKVGGVESGEPRLFMRVPIAHLEVPSFSVEDVITLEANMHGQGSTIGEADEVELTYYGTAITY